MKILKWIISLTVLIIIIGCASGSYIITGKIRPAIDKSSVTLYLKAPKKYEVIGIVEASSRVGLTGDQATQNKVIDELKSQAARIGANGILISDTKNKSTGLSGIYSDGFFLANTEKTKTARGKAIFIIEK